MRPSFFLLLGFFSPFFFYWQELSDMIVKVVLLMKNKVRLLLHNHVLSLSVFLQVIAWPAVSTTCPHHVRKPGRKWVREQSAHLSPFHQGRARCHREQDHGEEVGCQEKGGAAGSKHCGNKTQRVFFFLVDEINRSWWWCGLRTARLEV